MDPERPPVPDEEVESRMRPGRFSQGGFLGPHERLADVLRRDSQAVAALGLTCEALAAPLEALLEAARAAAGRPVQVPPHFEVQVTRYKGMQMCPWSPTPHHGQCVAGGGVRFGSVDWRICNLQTGQVME